MAEGDKAAAPPAGKPKASSYNRRSIPQGIIDLTSVPAFRPIRHDRDRDGRWVIRYYLFDDAAAAAFARDNMLASPSRESGLLARSALPRSAASIASGSRLASQAVSSITHPPNLTTLSHRATPRVSRLAFPSG